jgi:hypothetical protein
MRTTCDRTSPENAKAFVFLTTYCPDIEDVLSIATDRENDPTIRAAAALIALLHPNGGPKTLHDTGGVVREVCRCDRNDHFIDIIAFCLAEVSSDKDAASVTLVKDLFDSLRDDYKARYVLESIIIRWNEGSTAPVTSAQLRDDWLGVSLRKGRN